MESFQAVTISDEKLTEVDWSTTSIDIGVVRGDGKERWLPFDRTDLELLIQLLRRPVIPGVLPAAEASDSLNKLARWAEIAKDFSERMNLP